MLEEKLFIALSVSSPDPMYKQVTDQIKNAIASGALAPGDKLPSVRELTDALKISAITIKRAYLDLENEGFILTRAGLGSFVAEIDRGRLRDGKMAEFRSVLKGILVAGGRFGITADDIIRQVREIQED
jgi:GntR family transcriptional regulator